MSQLHALKVNFQQYKWVLNIFLHLGTSASLISVIFAIKPSTGYNHWHYLGMTVAFILFLFAGLVEYFSRSKRLLFPKAEDGVWKKSS
jgi:hypothetical protein